MVKLYDTYVKKVVVQGGDVPAGAAVMTDSVSFQLIFPDTVSGQTDQATFAIEAQYSDTNAAQSDAVTFGVEGYQDSNATPSEAYTTELTRWATTQTTSGTAPTNPANATGQNNGTLANVKAGGVANGTSTLTLTIVAPFASFETNPQVRAYYRTNAGVADTFVKRITYNGSTTVDMPDGNFLTTPYTVNLTGVNTAQSITATFTHSVAVVATGGSIDVDAVGIASAGAF